MQFPKFQEFLKTKDVTEQTNQGLNRSALDYERRLNQFRARFPDTEEAQETITAAGYPSIAAFVADKDERKWAKLKMKGAENWVN